jgi:hypothetical protein
LDFKSFVISDLIKNDDFTEVLILEDLVRAKCKDGWLRAVNWERDEPPAAPAFLREIRKAWVE